MVFRSVPRTNPPLIPGDLAVKNSSSYEGKTPQLLVETAIFSYKTPVRAIINFKTTFSLHVDKQIYSFDRRFIRNLCSLSHQVYNGVQMTPFAERYRIIQRFLSDNSHPYFSI